MPLYEYKCDSCGDVFEVLQKFADQPLSVHDGCGGQVHRLLTAPSFQFKGTGWYVTDYARGGNGSSGGKWDAANGEKNGEKKAEGKAEPSTKTESKKVESTAKKES